MECPKEFDDIRPFYDSEFHDKMKVLVTEPGFEHAVRYVLRDINYELFCQELLTIDNKKDFQLLVMRSFLEGLTQKTTKGLTGNNLDVLDKAKSLHIHVQPSRHCARCLSTQSATHSKRNKNQ